jgi:kinetochore protein Spc24
MVLFDEDPVVVRPPTTSYSTTKTFTNNPPQLISETTNQFHIAPDKDSLSRISTSLSALGSNRTSRLTAQQNALKSLSRRLNNLHSQHEYEENRHDAGKHASEILALDAEKFRVAKSAYDVEVEGERLEGELAGLKAQLETLEREGVEGGRRGSESEGDEVLYVVLRFALGGLRLLTLRFF